MIHVYTCIICLIHVYMYILCTFKLAYFVSGSRWGFVVCVPSMRLCVQRVSLGVVVCVPSMRLCVQRVLLGVCCVCAFHATLRSAGLAGGLLCVCLPCDSAFSGSCWGVVVCVPSMRLCVQRVLLGVATLR